MDEAALFGQGLLLVVTDPEKLDPEFVRAHRDDSITLLMLHQALLPRKNKKIDAPVRDVVPNAYRFNYEEPPPWDIAKSRVEFVVKEARSYDMTFPEPLALALVNRVGSDLGLLSFEVMKAVLYRQVLGGGTEITPDIVMATMWQFGEVTMRPLVEAVGSADEASVMKVIDRIKAQGGAEIIPSLAWLGNAAVSWLHSAALEGNGSPPEECASRMGVKEYHYKTNVAPFARKWGVAGASALIRHLGKVQRAAVSSRIDPWIELEVRLVQACRVATGGTPVPLLA